MKQYVELVNRILQEGTPRQDRTGVGTISIFNHNMSFDLRERFPLVTVKQTKWRVAFLEMLFFLSGETNIKWLNERGCNLWDAWALDCDGNLGPIYGKQFRKWECYNDYPYIDQIANLITSIKTDPYSRRHIINLWNVGDISLMALPPCHLMTQYYVQGGYLDVILYMRSSDVALGLPFNIAAYAMLLTLIARATNYKPRHLHVQLADAHLYTDHIEPMKQVVNNKPIDCPTKLIINNASVDIDGYDISDFSVVGYEAHPFVKMKVAI